MVEERTAKLREKCLHLQIKVLDDSIHSHKILDEKPSINEEVTSLAIKYLEDEELAEFATNELLPVLEKSQVTTATEIVIENYKQFRSKKNA